MQVVHDNSAVSLQLSFHIAKSKVRNSFVERADRLIIDVRQAFLRQLELDRRFRFVRIVISYICVGA